jgi:AmiR/NasT family two-component response regulator
MEHRGLTEDQAYRMLRQSAMDQGRRLVEVAEAVIGFSDILAKERPVRRG